MSFSRLGFSVILALFFVLFDNVTFATKVANVYTPSWENAPFLASLGIILGCVIIIVLLLFSNRYTFKPIAILLLLCSSFTNYFMQTYRVIIDDTMIQNTLETNAAESFDLITLTLVGYVVFLGILPSIAVYYTPIRYGSFKKELLDTLKGVVVSIVLIVIMLFSFSQHYTSFFRENKPLRMYTNPTFYLYSTGKYVYDTFYKRENVLQPLGRDAKQIKPPQERRRLTVMVVGEAARANRFSLNGYERQTNPLLAKENIINLSNVSSCGTSTAISVPCMFSHLERRNYNDATAKNTENVIDIVHHAGVSVLWRDNNSDSKGVAIRVPYEDFRSPKKNSLCDEECRDEGMLVGLQEYINAQQGDILIVLHQMGNHGPAYYKRYPKAFEIFTPTCKTNQVEQCTPEEIGNAYDNAIVYTDYFLSKTISFLKANESVFETALVYMADHGESLGEKGLYLHGIPYFMAPREQTHVGAFMWFGKGFETREEVQKLRMNAENAYSHDNLFHTLLGLMRIETSVYDKTKDILFKGNP
jgi:lipid A ethanolaminephosphotransferase